MYSTHNAEKSAAAERFVRTLKKNLQTYDSYFKKCLV